MLISWFNCSDCRPLSQICEGATKEERKLWSLGPASEFHYLNQSTCYKLKRVDNAEEYTVRLFGGRSMPTGPFTPGCSTDAC